MATTKHLRPRDARPIALSACAALYLLAPSTTKAQTPERLTDPNILAFIASLDENGIPPGHRLVEGDIIVPDDQTIAGTYAPNLWPNGRVVFVFHDDVATPDRQSMRLAMSKWEAVANVRFVYLNQLESHVILIQNSTENNSAVGMSDVSVQVININAWNAQDVLVHELGHALGFWHEQSRRDRGDYIRIHWERIPEDREHNFDAEYYSDAYGPYDYASIMHYSQCAFSDCGNNCREDPAGCCWNNKTTCRTIEVLSPCDTTCQDFIGQPTQLSYLDKVTMSFLYPEDDWVFVDQEERWTGEGTFDEPYRQFTMGEIYVPLGGTIWIQPGSYWAMDTYRTAVTLRAPLGGVLLRRATGVGPAIPRTCCP